MAKLKTQIQLRRDTATNLANVVPVTGEPVYATDTKKLSIGDGSTKFSALKDYGKEYVSGPASSTDNALARFDGTTGQLIQNSTATLSDQGQLKITNWRDERYASSVASARWTTTAKEIIIYTKIKFVSSAVMPIVRLHGYAYGQNAPIELKIGFYIYNSNYTNYGAVSMGAWRPEIRLFKYTHTDGVDYVAIGFIGTCYYGGFQVDVQAAALGTLDSNILTTGWSVSTFTTEGNVPAVGTDRSAKVPYKSTLASLTINGTAYDGSSAVTLNLATGNHTHDEYVVGPDSATGNAIAIFDETTGKKIKNSGSTIDSNGYITTPRLLVTANSNTLSIGAQNASFCHIYNSANIPFIFNQGLQVTGNKDLGTSQYDWKDLYLSGSIKKVKSTTDATTYTLTLPDKTGTVALTSDIPSLADYVKGPASATDNAVARFDATTGKLIQNSGVTIDDSNNISTAGSLKLTNNGDVMWNSGSWWQRIKITDDSSANTNVFEFQQSSDSGVNWTSLFTILDNGSVKAKKFVTDGSSNQYVVLGDGTTKALSDFAMDTDIPEVSGLVTGPSSSTDNALARYDGATGKIIQDSTATLDDSGNLKIAGSLYVPENKYAYFGTDQLASFRANQNGAFIVGAYGDIYFRGNLQSNDSSSSASGIQLSKTYLKPEVTNTIDLGASDKIWKNIYAAKFVTNGSSNQYVVLGDGTTKALSDFAMDTEIPSLDNYVTLDGVQTISGKKTFSGGLAITSADQNTNMVYFLGIDAFANGGAVKWTNKSDIKLPYSQITGTPTIPTVNNGTLTIQRNGTTVATFTANQAGNTTANITDNDTLNTAGSTNDEAKLYLVGAKSQAASAQTFSDAQVYTEAGELNATSVCVAEHGQMKYDSTNQCIRFVIV